MKIGIVIPYDPNLVIGGVERFALDLQRGLKELGQEADLLYGKQSLIPRQLKIAHSMNILAEAKTLENYDILHFNGWVGWLAQFFKHKPRITTFHGTAKGATDATKKYRNPIRNYYNYKITCNLEKMAVNNSFPISVSNRVSSELKEYYGKGAKQTIYNGIDLKRFNQQVTLKHNIVAFIGSHKDPVKGYSILDKLNAHKRVLEGVSYENMPHELADCKVFAQPSRYEGCSISLIEAMASGLPPVCFDVGAAGELIQDGENGFLVPKYDNDRFIDKVNLLLTNEELRKRMAGQAKSSVQHLSYLNMAKKYLKLYEVV